MTTLMQDQGRIHIKVVITAAGVPTAILEELHTAEAGAGVHELVAGAAAAVERGECDTDCQSLALIVCHTLVLVASIFM